MGRASLGVNFTVGFRYALPRILRDWLQHFCRLAVDFRYTLPTILPELVRASLVFRYGHAPFFFSFSVECVLWCWKKFRNRRPWYPRVKLKVSIHTFGLTKCSIHCKKCFCFCSCFSLCCYFAHFFFRLKELFQVKNGLTTSPIFFFKMPKISVGRTTLSGEKKKEDGLLAI